MKAIQEWVQFEYSAADRERFRDGDLWKEWLEQHKKLFDERDKEIFESQADMSNAGYKFFESLAAVRIFEEYGYHSLLEKYAQTKSGKHPHKEQVVHELNDPLLNAAIAYLQEKHGGHGPDLLVYTADRSEWFFAEVKSPTDSLKPKQAEKFRILAEMTGRPIRLVTFSETVS